jgi:ribosomal protein S27E
MKCPKCHSKITIFKAKNRLSCSRCGAVLRDASGGMTTGLATVLGCAVAIVGNKVLERYFDVGEFRYLISLVVAILVTSALISLVVKLEVVVGPSNKSIKRTP